MLLLFGKSGVTLPTKLQRELFDNAGSMGELLDTPRSPCRPECRFPKTKQLAPNAAGARGRAMK